MFRCALDTFCSYLKWESVFKKISTLGNNQSDLQELHKRFHWAVLFFDIKE